MSFWLVVGDQSNLKETASAGDPAGMMWLKKKGFIPSLFSLIYRSLGAGDAMTESDLSLELARLADAPPIAAMSRALIEYGLRWRWTAERVAASIRHPDVNVLVARTYGRIAGFGIMRYGVEDAHLDLLAVAPPYRRLGVARQLLNWLEECALVAGTFKIELEVRAENKTAQLFYQDIGYRIIGRLPGYYQGVEAALRMGRDLSSKPSDPGPLLPKPFF